MYVCCMVKWLTHPMPKHGNRLAMPICSLFIPVDLFSAPGVCALSVDSEKNYIAYPSSSQTGEVQIFDAMNLVCT